MKRARASANRKPTYPAAIRLARLVMGLGSRPGGWSFDAIRDALKTSDRKPLSERTLLRYVAALRRGLRDDSGRPLIETVSSGGGRRLRFARSPDVPSPRRYRAAALYLMLTMVEFLEGTVFKEMAKELWEETVKLFPAAEQPRMENLSRKFYAVPYAPKNYKDFDDLIDQTILPALMSEQRLRIDYGGKIHEFDPYTMLSYRGGLYLIGLSHAHKKIICLAVERIRKAELVRGSDNQPVRFAYPRSYRPASHMEGMFGLIDGPETEVEILLLADSEKLLGARKIHPTQKLVHRGGKAILTMRVRGTIELRNWILGLGPWVKVLKPAALREEVAGLFAEAAALYRQTGI